MKEEMTRERLAGLRALRREVTRTKTRLAELRERSVAAEGSEAVKQAYARAKAALERYLTELLKEEAELLGYIQKIKDGTVRELFMLRYYDGIGTWQQIAFLMGEHDESYVRRKHNAYLQKVSRGEEGELAEGTFIP